MPRNGQVYYHTDSLNIATSNWLRWVNCARHATEENVKYLYCQGKVFYIANRDIYPGRELLLYYGDDYAEDLGIRYKLEKKAKKNIRTRTRM